MPDRSVSYIFKGNFSNLSAGLAVAARNTQELGSKLTGLDKQGRQMRSGLATVANGAGKIGLVAAAGFVVAVSSAAKFEQAISHVAAATHETTGNMKLLRQAALDAGKATQYSATEAAGAIEALAKAGVSTTDILDGGLSGALNLAAAGSMDVAAAAEIAATAMTQFKLSGDQIPHVADLLAAGAGKAQGEVSDMGMALQQAGLVAAQTGLSIEETTGALAEFAANGLIGSDAGTSFKTMLQALNPNSKKASELMAGLGISAYDAQGNFVGMSNFAGQLQESLGKLSVEQQNAALKTIFGSDAVRAASIIFKDGATGVEQWQSNVNDAGYAAETAALKTDNLAGDVERLGGALETAFIGAGAGSQGPLRSLVQGATETVNALTGIPGPAKTAVTALAGITALGAGGIWFGSKVVDGIASMSEALQNLGINAQTTRSKVAAIGTAGTAAALGLGTFLDTMNQLDSLQRSSEAADATVASIQDLNDALQFSNVGKYAADLHINLGRLTQDLIDNGEQGEYVQRVLEQLGDSSHGFKALMKSESGNILPFYTDSASKAYDANKDLKSILDEMPDTLADTSEATDEAAGRITDYGTAAASADVQTEQLNKAIFKQREAAQGTAKSFVGLGDSLDDSKVSLSEWIKSLQDQANALRNFRVNAETAAKKGLREGLIAALEEAGPAGAMRMKQLAGATKEQIAAANRSWQAGQREIKKYTDAVGGVPVSTGTRADVKTFEAMAAIARLKLALAQIKSKDVNVNVHYRNIGNKLAGMAADRSADGGTVPKTGMPYADRHPYLLADGERVTSNRYGQSDKATHLLDLINSGKLTDKMVGYADGGTAGRKPGGKDFSYTLASGNGFEGVTVSHTVSAATAAIAGMRLTIRSLNSDIHDAAKAIRDETRQRDRAAKSVSVAQAEVDRLNGLYDNLAGSIASGLAANQFDQGDPWTSGGGFAGILDALNTSTANAKAFSAASGTLSGSLSGAALQSVLEQGLGTVQTFAGLTEAQLAQYQADFDANAAALAEAGSTGAGAVYGADQAKANQILEANQAELRRANQELASANAAHARAEKQRDRAEQILGDLKDFASDIKSELKKNRGEADSGARGKR